MMDVLFINSTETPLLRDQTNGTLLLGTRLLQAGFKTDILRFYEIDHYGKDYPAFLEAAVTKILARQPKSVSFYTLWPYFHIMLRMAQIIKERSPQTVIVFGGPQASFSAQQTMERMPWVDYICTGEGEDLVVPFFRAVLENDGAGLEAVPGVFYRRDGQILQTPGQPPLTNLETLPQWDERLLPPVDLANNPDLHSRGYSMPIDAGRGCPFRCSFCCTNQFLHRSYRLKSADRILQDIKHYRDRYGIQSFFFSHDAFTTNKALVSELCDRLIEEDLGITWKCCSRVDLLTEELALKMKQAGMRIIDLGLESGSPRMQEKINKRLDLDKARHMIKFLMDNGIRVTLFFMYGFPEETEEDLKMTLDMFFELMDYGLNHASMALCRFYPCTKDTEIYFDQLVYDPKIDKLTRGVFGYQEELQMFLDNKEMFPFFYHLPTPVRDTYQYLFSLGHMYQRFPRFIRQLRKRYPGDSLAFAREFLERNREVFEKGIRYAADVTFHDPVVLVKNFVPCLQLPYEKQLLGLLTFDFDLYTVQKSTVDTSIQKVYDFSYVEYKLNLPFEKYSSTKTEILLEKKDGKINMRVLRLVKDE